MIVFALCLLSLLGFTFVAMAGRPADAARARAAVAVTIIISFAYTWGLT